MAHQALSWLQTSHEHAPLRDSPCAPAGRACCPGGTAASGAPRPQGAPRVGAPRRMGRAGLGPPAGGRAGAGGPGARQVQRPEARQRARQDARERVAQARRHRVGAAAAARCGGRKGRVSAPDLSVLRFIQKHSRQSACTCASSQALHHGIFAASCQQMPASARGASHGKK